jgi:hypothetical protein
MDRIHDNPKVMKIEHWQCQAQYPAEQLNYRNLLGVCLGGQGLPSDQQHCDTKKGYGALQWNPANPEHRIEARIRYEPNGSIRSDDAVFDEQLNDVLNLNIQFLKNNRKNIYDAVVEWWKWEKSRRRGPVPRERLMRERDRHVTGTGELAPFRQVAVWLLGQKLARMAE